MAARVALERPVGRVVTQSEALTATVVMEEMVELQALAALEEMVQMAFQPRPRARLVAMEGVVARWVMQALEAVLGLAELVVSLERLE